METKLFFVIFQLFPLKLKLIIYTLFFLIYFAFCHENKGVWFTVRFLQFSKQGGLVQRLFFAILKNLANFRLNPHEK